MSEFHPGPGQPALCDCPQCRALRAAGQSILDRRFLRVLSSISTDEELAWEQKALDEIGNLPMRERIARYSALR